MAESDPQRFKFGKWKESIVIVLFFVFLEDVVLLLFFCIYCSTNYTFRKNKKSNINDEVNHTHEERKAGTHESFEHQNFESVLREVRSCH